jgi:ribosomal protein S18 acetylase RimI-like enzyme
VIHGLTVRRLARTDLDAVVALDAELSGRTRRAYFERRLAAALRQPELHVQFAAEDAGALCGHALGRLLQGEFGHEQPGLRLEVISVSRAAQGRGIGRALHAALEEEAKKRALTELRTSAGWRDHAMLEFLDGAGYALAPVEILERALQTGASRAQAGGVPLHVRLLTARDLDEVARIDCELTGRERRPYIQRALDEALRESGVRVSLAADRDGRTAGYVMARADLGDFGRTEPVAVIDTLGVAPAFARQGIGRALLAQLIVNLTALRIERVETAVAAEDLELLRFFRGAGFVRGERLAFVKQLGT